MTNDEAKKMLKAKLACLKHETSGTDYECNQHLCEGCNLNYEQGNMGEQKEALDIAINVLEIVSCIKEKCAYCPHCKNCDVDDDTLEIKALEQQPCEDAISRQAVKNMLAAEWTKYMPMELDVNLSFVLEKISELPSVMPKPKIGRWMATENEEMNIVGYYCSCCDLPMETEEKTAYCPNCGAKMEVKE